MLNQEDNDFATQVGPGTPMGALMREHWVPAMLASELPAPDCDPVRVLLLGEQLIGFRDTSGKVGLVHNLCPHRGASLFFGRNEEGGLRCVYHGWKFDTEGNCVDMPNEPAESNFKSRIKATAYPCVEKAGIIWTYMGPRETPPAMPGLEGLELPEGEYDVGAAMRDANWLQGLEGDLDTSHVSFLHSGATKPEDLEEGTERYYMALHKDPRYMSLDTDFGSMYGAYRPAGPGEQYWRIGQFLFPCIAHIPTDRNVSHRMWVPMDDHHTMFFILHRTPKDPDQRLTGHRRIQRDVPLEPENSTDWLGRFRLTATAANDYLIDREVQRTMGTYTGIPGVFTQDQALTESMSPILDRTIEHVGTSDVMVIRIRRRLIEAARALAEHKVPPPGVEDPEVFRTRSASVILPETVDWIEGTEVVRTAEFLPSH
jgi:phenylpropionate dioxygenase-like ring-hydroxylating dioxygenase large terminal subunit